MEVIHIKTSIPSIGLIARNGASGPEKELVEAFKNYVPSCFRWSSGSAAILHEPQMETGFPDLVIIRYTPPAYRNWTAARFCLKPIDIKILHQLILLKGVDLGTLIRLTGFDDKVLFSSVDRLLEAEMISRPRSILTPRSLRSLFGIRAIVAVEAKIKNWPDAFKQAQMGQWFASETYVLSPVEKPSRNILERSSRTGVGILLLNGKGVHQLRVAQRLAIPSSYGSWMLNEWLGRYIQRGC